MQKSLYGGRFHIVSKTNVEDETFILLRHFVQYLPRVESQLCIIEGIEREESIEWIYDDEIRSRNRLEGLAQPPQGCVVD
jgi:hypothetical protein